MCSDSVAQPSTGPYWNDTLECWQDEPPLTPADIARRRKRDYDQDRYYANREREVARALVNANKRYAAKMRRVPPWFDATAAKEVYDLAAEFREAGFVVDVDHIVPLQGAEVSGLHWHGNLRVCLASVNRSKNNRVSTLHDPCILHAQRGPTR